jgi:hypothetical protein
MSLNEKSEFENYNDNDDDNSSSENEMSFLFKKMESRLIRQLSIATEQIKAEFLSQISDTCSILVEKKYQQFHNKSDLNSGSENSYSPSNSRESVAKLVDLAVSDTIIKKALASKFPELINLRFIYI